MSKPISIPNTFASQSGAVPASQLDSNFSTIADAINDPLTYSNYAADTGSANAYVVALNPAISSYTVGLLLAFTATNTNTGASTLNVNSLGAKNITRKDGTVLQGSDIVAGQIALVQYDGTNFQLLSPYAPSTNPVGTVLEYAGIALPSGYLWADGSLVPRTTYSNLFASQTQTETGTTTSGSAVVTAITTTTGLQVGWYVSGGGIPTGTTILSVDSSSQVTLSVNATASAAGVSLTFSPFGLGDGSTTFAVVDRRGRVGVGAGQGSGLSNRILGQYAGEETHLLTALESGLPGHTHVEMDSSGNILYNINTAGSNSSYSPTALTNSISGPISTGSAGPANAASAHNNMQPYVVCNYIVKY